jgi:hypothetical protein
MTTAQVSEAPLGLVVDDEPALRPHHRGDAGASRMRAITVVDPEVVVEAVAAKRPALTLLARKIEVARPLGAGPEENRHARIRPLAGSLAPQRTLITTAARIVGASRRSFVLAGGGKPPTAP